MKLRHLATGLGGVIVVFVLLVGIFAPLLAPHDPFAQDLMRRMVPPEWMDGGSTANWLGTDQLGRDYLSRLIYGARISMLIGVATVITSGLIGITLGSFFFLLVAPLTVKAPGGSANLSLNWYVLLWGIGLILSAFAWLIHLTVISRVEDWARNKFPAVDAWFVKTSDQPAANDGKPDPKI